MVIRFPSRRDAEQRPQQVGHRVFDGAAGKHELIARVVDDRLDARLQPPEHRAVVAAVELAELLVDHREDVVDAVGDRRIDGVAAVLHLLCARSELALALLALRVARLGERNEIGEELDLFGHARPPAIDDVDDLLEIEQPERQAERARADDLGLVLEGGGIFVVRIDQEHARRFGGLQDAVEDAAPPRSTCRSRSCREPQNASAEDPARGRVASIESSWLSLPIEIVCLP